ncbi:HK97 family phage prohead protease [Woodsholea maritima]|uniref:HK97 family phage prohead protease n=1 Tax=Woodsholea maritima TaxID=240237 RepID=UPI000376A2A0|nr:HK97 family phage prohead protease [Woodsholea maritima]
MSLIPLSGYASVFDVPDLSGDVTVKGCFEDSLGERAVLPMLHNHDLSRQIGRWSEIYEDAYGLYVEGVLDLTYASAQEVWPALAAGRLSGLSIGFETRDSQPRPGGGRILQRVDLYEVSLVALALLPQARLDAPPDAGAPSHLQPHPAAL